MPDLPRAKTWTYHVAGSGNCTNATTEYVMPDALRGTERLRGGNLSAPRVLSLGLDRLGLLATTLLARLLGGRGRELERELAVLDGDIDLAAVEELAEQQFLGKWLLDLLLDQAAHRARAIHLVIAALGEPRLRFVVELDMDLTGGELEFERSEEHTSELQSLMRISYAVFCLKK